MNINYWKASLEEIFGDHNLKLTDEIVRDIAQAAMYDGGADSPAPGKAKPSGCYHTGALTSEQIKQCAVDAMDAYAAEALTFKDDIAKNNRAQYVLKNIPAKFFKP